MARIKLTLPEKLLATIELSVRISDVNYGNHLGNDALVGLLQEARIQWLHSMKYSELNIEGTSLIQSDLAVSYLKEAFYGDHLKIELFLGEISSSGFELYYLVTKGHAAEYLEIAKAKTGLVFFDYQARRVMAVPPAFLRKLHE